MASYFNFRGKIKWARVYEQNKDTKFDEAGVYVIDFYPDDIQAVQASGIQSEIRMDAEGEQFIKLRRKHEQFFKKELKVMGPPQVLKDGKIYTGDIGNGTSVVVNVEIFPTRKGLGHRLSRVTITNLVEYNREEQEIEADDEIPF